MPCLIFRMPFRKTILLCGGDDEAAGLEWLLLVAALLLPLRVVGDGVSNKYFDLVLAVVSDTKNGDNN